MNRIAALFVLALAVPATWAQRAPDTYVPQRQFALPADTPKQVSVPNEAELLSHQHYRAKNGREVHSPARSINDQVPNGAVAKCRDGTYSFSQHRRGTCSRHGGVGIWL